MFSTNVFAGALLVAGTALAQIPPASFNLPTSPNQLSVVFQNGAYVETPGVHYGVGIPNPQPAIALPTTAAVDAASQRYILIMIDPDAPTPANPTSAQILHWLQPDLVVASNRTLVNTTAAFVPYARPQPPITSPPHRYIQYLFRQPSNYTVPAPAAGYSATNRSRFNIEHFVAAAALGAPVAANWAYVSNQTGVPALYTSPPNGSYPSNVTATASATATATRPAMYTGAAVKGSVGAVYAVLAGAVGLSAALLS